MSEFEYLNGGNSEAQDKLATSYLLAQTSVGLARTGVLSGLTVAQTTTASGSVLIAPGAAVVQASVLAGASVLVDDTTKTLDIFTAHPVGGLPRNDIVVFDATTATLTVIEGDPNAAPTDPTVPATVCALYRLRHAASATTIPTAKIDDLRVMTRLAGVRAPAVSLRRTFDTTARSTWDNIVTAPAITGDGVKKYKITASAFTLQCSVPGDVFELIVKDGAAIVGKCRVNAVSFTDSVSLVATDVPAVGSHSYSLSCTRVLGSGTFDMLGAVGSPIEIIVEQIA